MVEPRNTFEQVSELTSWFYLKSIPYTNTHTTILLFHLDFWNLKDYFLLGKWAIRWNHNENYGHLESEHVLM